MFVAEDISFQLELYSLHTFATIVFDVYVYEKTRSADPYLPVQAGDYAN